MVVALVGTKHIDLRGLGCKQEGSKHLFGEKEFTQFTITFWTVDDKIFMHPRNKVQIPFILSVFCWTAARIGAFFPEKKNESKKGLQHRVSIASSSA